MAKRGKMAGKAKSKGKKAGPSSSDRVIKTRSMDALIGIQDLEIAEEVEKVDAMEQCQEAMEQYSDIAPSPASEIHLDFSDWLSGANRAAQDVSLGKNPSPPILRSNIARNLESCFEKTELKTAESQSRDADAGARRDTKPSIVCYVIGANPPINILDGFVRKIWKDAVVKVGLLAKGIFIIRFQNLEMRDRILEQGYVFFDRKPMVMKPWNSVDDFTKEEVTSVPTWIQLQGLDIKYWGESSLFKIVGQLGDPLQVDQITKNRDRLQYPRILIQVSLSQEFPKVISFIDEHNHEIELEVKYEWIPLVCYNCSGIGHDTQSCRKKESKEEQVKQHNGNFFVTFIYGFNDEQKREELWGDLERLAAGIHEPWIILGDFNEIMFANERIGRKAQNNPSPRLRDCMEACDMSDLKYSGSFFTWNNKQKPEDRIFSKIDRAMVNSRWSCAMPDSEAVFLPELSFDHSPILVSIIGDVNGTKMFKVVSKLKRLKLTLKKINQEGFSEIQKADLMAKNELIAAQDALTKNPLSLQLMEAEQEANRRYNETHKAYSMFLSQKAKINWASFGDENSAFFHASLKSRRMQNKIFSIEDEQGTWFDSPDGVQHAFLSYYEKLLGTSMQNRRSVLQTVVNLGPKITNVHESILLADYTSQEVKDALFSIPGIKAPGPDGFGSAFYQDNWDTVGTEFTEAILSFLNTGKILKEINHTTITLIPKIACPKNVADFRPISCCNVLYKTATKVLCNRLTRVLPDLIAENQGGFVHGRYISHNVLVCQDMGRLYGRKNCTGGIMKPHHCIGSEKLVGVKNQVKAKVDRQTFSMQKFSISNTYHLLFIRPEKKDWCKHVWDRLVIPKHKFILWLVLLDRLKTKDRIWGARNDVLWNQKQWQTRIIVDRVQQESKRRIVGVWPSKTKEKDKNWVLNL
uniref:CCHC-type domain-containing protein n=1 Tax=Cannabis sativa TaxID=3483 RepID=A0A803QP78_CANSA